jgi:hypothetical protein
MPRRPWNCAGCEINYARAVRLQFRVRGGYLDAMVDVLNASGTWHSQLRVQRCHPQRLTHYLIMLWCVALFDSRMARQLCLFLILLRICIRCALRITSCEPRRP